MRRERVIVVPATPVFTAVDALLSIAPESVYVVPEVLVDEIVRSSYYDSLESLSRGCRRAVYEMGRTDLTMDAYYDFVDDFALEAAREWRDVLCYHGGICGGDLVEYVMCRQSRSIAMRVWLYE